MLPYADDLQRFQHVLAEFFASLAGEQDFKRRPTYSLRLVSPGDPPAKLAARPSWNRRERKLRPEKISLELVVERVQLNGTPLPSSEVGVEVYTYQLPRVTSISMSHGIVAMQRLG